MMGKTWEPFSFFIVIACLLTAVAATYSANEPLAATSLPLGFTATPWFDEGDQHGANFGHAVSYAGDVNGDGFADIIASAPQYSTDEYKGGAVFVYYGTRSGLPDHPDEIIGGERKGSDFGAAISTAGDVNGDSFDDIIIGAYNYTTGNESISHEGRIYVYYGSPSGLLTTGADWTFTGDHTDENLGYAVASAGDVNHDSYDDLIVGARRYNGVGAALLFYGSASGLTQTEPDWMFIGSQPGADLGACVNSAGDVNHDNFADVIIGAPHYDHDQDGEGAAFLFLGSAAGLKAAPDWMAEGNNEGASFGASVNTAGDVNGDTFDDVIVGAPHYSGAVTNEGGAFIFYGTSTGLANDTGWTAVSGQAGAHFGGSVATAGDINADGFDDVIIGSYLYNDDPEGGQSSIEGAIFVFEGAPIQPKSTGWTAVGDKADTEFGFSVSTAGDITGDGNNDVIVGAPGYRHDEKSILGRVYVYFGSRADWPFQTYLPVVLGGSS